MGLQLNTTSGNADLTTSAALDSLRSDSVSGTVTVVMPDNGGFDLSFHKLSGSFHSDFPTTQDGGVVPLRGRRPFLQRQYCQRGFPSAAKRLTPE